MILNGTREQQVKGIKKVRKMLGVVDNPPIKKVLNADGLLNKFVEFLDSSDDYSLKFNSSWIMINLASSMDSSDIKKIVDAGVVPLLVRLMHSKNENLQENAVWAIANIAGGSNKVGETSQLVDLVINSGALDPLLK